MHFAQRADAITLQIYFQRLKRMMVCLKLIRYHGNYKTNVFEFLSIFRATNIVYAKFFERNGVSSTEYSLLEIMKHESWSKHGIMTYKTL